MKKTYINISTLRYRKDTNPVYTAWTVFGVSVVFFLSIISIYALQEIRLNGYKEDAELLRKKFIDETVKEMTPAELAKTRGEVKIVNELIERESYSWVKLLTAVEDVVPKDAYITGIEPNLITGEVSLSGLAKGNNVVTNFVDTINASDKFEQATLISQNHMGKGTYRSQTVGFNLKARYVKETKTKVSDSSVSDGGGEK